MSHKIYTTEAFICGSTAHNTSDKNYLLFTRESGMLWVTARSVREERSKQRSALQDFSCVRVSLLKGKGGWKVGSVEALGNAFMSASSRKERALINAITLALRRYVHGEVALPYVYGDIQEVIMHCEYFALMWNKVNDLFMLRLLTTLGYIAPLPSWEMLITTTSLKEAYVLYTQEMEASVKKAIENAEKESHL